jgi:mannose-1-phosphate guanylyltransferase
MLEETISRIEPLISRENIRIVTGESMTRLILESPETLVEQQLLTEPFGRNTCLAIGLAALHLEHAVPDAVMAVLSADHLIRPEDKLLEILKDGAAIAAKEDCLITIGIVPTRPETAYGYIKQGELFKKEGNSSVYAVSSFAEKPKAEVAQEYYYSRQYLWNSGMFIWSARSILAAIKKHQPEIGELFEEYAATIGTADELSARRKLYDSTESISIDYAVLEHASNVLTIKADIVWDDVGSWNSLERYKDRDSENNVLVGNSVTQETFETTVYNEEDGLIACLGVSDLVIVRSGDITLVAHKTKVDRVKELLAKLDEDEENKKYL